MLELVIVGHKSGAADDILGKMRWEEVLGRPAEPNANIQNKSQEMKRGIILMTFGFLRPPPPCMMWTDF